MTDARFEDGAEAPLNLGAFGADDLGIISALCQDAVTQVGDLRFDPRRHEFALLLNRFRWENRTSAPERVRAGLLFRGVMAVKVQGIDRSEAGMILSLLSIGWEAGADGAGRVVLTFAGDGAIALEVEALDATLRDLTRPWTAPSGRAPAHD